MATTLYVEGKNALFRNGWTSKIEWVRLYDATNTLIDEQPVTFEYVGNTLVPTADIVFDCPAGTNDASYVRIGYTKPTPLDIIFYDKDLPALYDFPTAGTLTIDSWEITLGGSHITAVGKEALFETGWENLITWGKLYTVADALVDSQNTSFETNSSTGSFICTNDIVFNVSGGTNNVTYINLGYTNGSDVVLYKRIMSPTYNFSTAGTLTVDTWTISV